MHDSEWIVWIFRQQPKLAKGECGRIGLGLLLVVAGDTRLIIDSVDDDLQRVQ